MRKNLLLFSFAFLLTGCATFSPNNRTISWYNGTPYLVPYGSTFVTLDSSNATHKIMVSALQKDGYNHCIFGNLFWAKTENFNKHVNLYNKVTQTTNAKEQHELIQKAWNTLFTPGKFWLY